MLTQNKPTVGLIATSNYENYSVDTDGYKGDDFPTCWLSNPDDDENYETEYPINIAKPLPSSEARIDTYLKSSIVTETIVATMSQVFPSAKVPASLSSIYVPRKPSPIAAVTIVVTIVPVKVVTRSPIEKEKTPFRPVTTTVFPGAKDPACLTYISVPIKQLPVTTDCINPRFKINGRYFINNMCGGGNQIDTVSCHWQLFYRYRNVC